MQPLRPSLNHSVATHMSSLGSRNGGQEQKRSDDASLAAAEARQRDAEKRCELIPSIDVGLESAGPS